MASKTTTRIGVLLADVVQFMDISPVDLFGMMSESYLSATFLPDLIKAGGVPIEIIYINPVGPTALQDCTSQMGIRVDASISDKICAPPVKGGEKTLDILYIPGPNPWTYKPTDAINAFIKGHFDSGADVLTVCTGVYPAGYAGILDDRKATGPKELLPELQQKFPKAAAWEQKRWTIDGNLWNSGMLCLLPSETLCTS